MHSVASFRPCWFNRREYRTITRQFVNTRYHTDGKSRITHHTDIQHIRCLSRKSQTPVKYPQVHHIPFLINAEVKFWYIYQHSWQNNSTIAIFLQASTSHLGCWKKKKIIIISVRNRWLDNTIQLFDHYNINYLLFLQDSNSHQISIDIRSYICIAYDHSSTCVGWIDVMLMFTTRCEISISIFTLSFN